MTAFPPPPMWPPPVRDAAPPPPPPRATDEARDDLVLAAVIAGALTVLGAVLGVVWGRWSPPGPAAQVLGGGQFLPDETEAFIAGDGRFLVLAATVGVAAATAAWFVRRRQRGALVLSGLALGSLVGALTMELVGHLTGGGSFTGKIYVLTDGSKERVTTRLPLSLHAQGLLLIEPLLAVLVYGLLVSFAVHDDLGRPDPGRDRLTGSRSVEPGGHAHHGGGDGDAAGAAQQGDLPAQ